MRVKSLYEGKNLGIVLHHMIGHRYFLAYGLKFVIILMSADNQLNTILLFFLMSNKPLERFF